MGGLSRPSRWVHIQRGQKAEDTSLEAQRREETQKQNPEQKPEAGRKHLAGKQTCRCGPKLRSFCDRGNKSN